MVLCAELTRALEPALKGALEAHGTKQLPREGPA